MCLFILLFCLFIFSTTAAISSICGPTSVSQRGLVYRPIHCFSCQYSFLTGFKESPGKSYFLSQLKKTSHYIVMAHFWDYFQVFTSWGRLDALTSFICRHYGSPCHSARACTSVHKCAQLVFITQLLISVTNSV